MENEGQNEKELTRTLIQIRNDLEDMQKSKIICNIPRQA